MVDKTLDIQLHLQGAVPFLKVKHGSPVKPEVRREKFIGKNIFYFLVIEVFILCENAS